MPDITMCMPKKCWMEHNCYRHMADPDLYQSWFGVEFVIENGEKCKFFEPINSL